MSERSVRPSEVTSGLRRARSFQGHQYRRRSKPISEQYKAELLKVLGLTVKNNSAFDCNEATGNIAFPAGCVIVVCQVRKKKEFHIPNAGHKSITCLRFSIDGHYIVTGESGHLPCVRVFSISERCQLASFQSHKFGISCVAFSPNSQYVISVGYQHDNVINVWNWRKNALAASNKVSIKVRALAFSENNSTFVTVGNRHVKFWYIEDSKEPDITTVPLKGRSGILGSVRHQTFCDVACGVGSDNSSTYALSRSGLLCQFNECRTIINTVQLETNAAYCIAVVIGYIVCGCSDGKILIYQPGDLYLISSFVSSENDWGLNDTVAVSMDSNNMWIHCVHADHTVKVWDLIDYNCPNEHASHSYHSECVWDVKVQPTPGEKSENCFYSCSNDATVKLWVMQDDNCEMKHNISINTDNQGLLHSKNGKAGIRSLCVSKDAKLLAVGDRNGVIHIYQTEGDGELKRMSQIEVHSGDILDISFASDNGMLASASRDRLIHILDSNHFPTYTINDHSAAVTAVQFAHLNNKLRLISCGLDKSLYFCTVEDCNGKVEIVRDRHIVEKHAMHDMEIVNTSVMVACGAYLKEYDIDSGKNQRSIRGCENSSAIIRVTTDFHHNVIAICCADKFMYLLSYASGDLLLELSGHSEVCTSLAFLKRDSEQYLITASADSCLFMWKLNRSAKLDDKVVTFHTQLHSHPEIAEDVDDGNKLSCDLNMTAYFGCSELNGSLAIGSNGETELLFNGGECEKSDGQVPDIEQQIIVSDSSKLMELDTSLPTWLTGERDKGVKKQVPGGKWAVRFQDQYNFLDTPRTVVDWDDINGHDGLSVESLSQNSDEEDTSEENEEKDADMSELIEDVVDNVEHEVNSPVQDRPTTGEMSSPDYSSKDKHAPKNEIFCDHGVDAATSSDEIPSDLSPVEDTSMKELRPIKCDIDDTTNISQSNDAISQMREIDVEVEPPVDTMPVDNENETASNEYLSALDVSHDSLSPSQCSGASPKKAKIDSKFVPMAEDDMTQCSNQTVNDKANDTVDEGTSPKKIPPVPPPEEDGKNKPDIPPAFANFLDSLSKKRPRSTPKSLPVKSLFARSNRREKSPHDNARYFTHHPRFSLEKKSEDVIDSKDSSASKNCQTVVDNLVMAYEEAESMYHKVSNETDPQDIEAYVLLQSTFSSLKERIDSLQTEIVKDRKNLNFESILREYSEKLCCMVCEEFRKKSLLKE